MRLAVKNCVRYPLSLRNVEDLLHERGIDICHETVRFWWQRFRPMFAAETRKRRVAGMRSSRWKWHLDEVFVKINGERHYLWRVVDHEGVHNHFNQDRSLSSRPLFKLNRTAALAEWLSLCAE